MLVSGSVVFGRGKTSWAFQTDRNDGTPAAPAAEDSRPIHYKLMHGTRWYIYRSKNG